MTVFIVLSQGVLTSSVDHDGYGGMTQTFGDVTVMGLNQTPSDVTVNSASWDQWQYNSQTKVNKISSDTYIYI